MSRYSVLLGEMPTGDERATEYVGSIRAAFPNAVEYLVSTTSKSATALGDHADIVRWCQRHGLTAVDTEFGDWRRINIMAGVAKGDILVVFEEDWWPADGAEECLLSEYSSGVDVVHFVRGDDIESPGNLTAPSSSDKTPRSKDSSGYAYAILRRTFLELRGYDERAGWTEVASLDFQLRLVWSGAEVKWLNETTATTVHHSGSKCGRLEGHGPEKLSQRRAKKDRILKDPSIYRNLVNWSVPREHRVPLVTVAVATKNRGEMLADSLYSVLWQTFQDFEIIVVDDGSETNEAEEIVNRIGDSRIRYVRQDEQGISAARNHAADISTGRLTAVHDDDDIMLPDRLEIGIRALTAEYSASYGSWVNFSDETGELRGFYGKLSFDAAVNAYNGQGPGHATWTLPTRLIRAVRYDEHLTASVDHNLATRLEWVGIRWKHVEKYVYLRRVHAQQVTSVDGGGQKIGHRLTRYANLLLASRGQKNALYKAGKEVGYPNIKEAGDLFSAFGGYLPDALVERTVSLSRNSNAGLFLTDLPDKFRYVLEDRDLKTGRPQLEVNVLSDIRMSDLASWRASGLVGVAVSAKLRGPDRVSETDGESSSSAIGGASDLEDRGVVEIEQVTAQVVRDRVDTVSEKFFSDHPRGSVLVVADAEPYTELVDEELLDGAGLARRVLAAGEFGVKHAFRIYGYGHALTGLSKAISLLKLNAQVNVSVLTKIEPGDGMLELMRGM